jgi:hypothetical protein
MKEYDEYKTTFKTKYGLYEWLVMFFWHTNTPNTFIRLMNHVLRAFIEKFIIIYFDDILIYNKNLNEYINHFCNVFGVLCKEQLYANLKNCTFCIEKIIFFWYVVIAHGIEIDGEKVKAIWDWPPSKFMIEVRSFHGLANFYRLFVKDFSMLVMPLIEIMKRVCWF